MLKEGSFEVLESFISEGLDKPGAFGFSATGDVTTGFAVAAGCAEIDSVPSSSPVSLLFFLAQYWPIAKERVRRVGAYCCYFYIPGRNCC